MRPQIHLLMPLAVAALLPAQQVRRSLPFELPAGAAIVHAADQDGDGDSDFVVRAADGSLSLHMNLGTAV